MKKLSLAKRVCMSLTICVAGAIASSAQTLTTLASFNGTNGSSAGYNDSLIQGRDGDFYGTTAGGGANGNFGTIFKITPGSALTTLYSFCSQTNCTDGAVPLTGLLQANDGNFYGTTSLGGTNCVSGNDANTGCGTIFKITPSGAFTSLYSFCSQTAGSVCNDGSTPEAPLIQGADGNLYGTTFYGGGNAADNNCFCGGFGTVFKLSLAGQLTTLYDFCKSTNSGGYCLDGALPNALVQATNGNFYGTTYNGGTGVGNSGGTIFKITPSGTLTTLYSFCAKNGKCPDGAYPFSGLIQAKNGDFYGVTRYGGYNSWGTLFQVTAAGVLTTLHRFDESKGTNPYAALIQGTDGNLYGTTDGNSAFSITADGSFNTIYTFCSLANCADGSLPSGLIQGKNGALYGTTNSGGADGEGTVFSLSAKHGAATAN
jgi:uncharacterized repeat protein (TIGR03803 family)